MIRGGLLLAALAACGGGEQTGAERGEELFASRSLSPSGNNLFSCATCHTAEPGDGVSDGEAGYRLYGVTLRPRFWGGDYDNVADAVDACLTFFMGGAELDTEDDDFHALYEYLVSISPDDAPSEALEFTVVETVRDVDRGDPGRGEEVYDAACRTCHGTAFGASGSIISSEFNLPDVTGSYDDLFPGIDPSLVVIEKVRHGRFFNIGGDMPLFSLEAMSDEDLGAVLSYLEL